MSKHTCIEKRVPIEVENPSLLLVEDKCIKCGLCKRVCENYITVQGYYDLERTNDEAICIHCGQCITACPVNAIVAKKEYHKVKEAVADSNKVVVFSTAPAVRVALGDEFGIEDGSFVEGKMVSLLRTLGANYVVDVNFGADLTIMEEASELIERVESGSKNLPQFTSCCPSWVEFAETFYPEILPQLSTAKSPIAMQGATIKTYFAKKMGIDPAQIVHVTIAPCTAKKAEVRREEMNAAGRFHGNEEMRDTDYVLTTSELAEWAKEETIDFAAMEDSSFDSLMGEGSGAGLIFGNTGGVMEAALRTAHYLITNEKAPAEFYELEPVRGMDEMKEATVKIGELELNVAVIYGTGNVRKLLAQLEEGSKQYHFIEVMTCPGGCISGAGQPKHKKSKVEGVKQARNQGLYNVDRQMATRASYENTEIKALYEDFYGKPLSERSEELLHTFYVDRSEILGEDDELEMTV
ncbi:periplasmic [Fe] hydrogenase large subunit [Lachnospiraceae bacterium KM106-2]|nr:periplasmic [Fe] hydrogenase large subunit [Lachnospiraceae bacterium KM106-2]